MDFCSPWYIFAAAFGFDLLLGDPRRLPHPIRLMGNIIESFEPGFRNIPGPLILSGLLFAGSCIFLTFGLTWLIIQCAYIIHPLLKVLVEILLIYYCMAAGSLQKEALAVWKALQEKNLEKARVQVSYIVGREVKSLGEKGVSMAAVETVSENLVDGFMAPMFFALLGGAPMAMAYKMVNTLDSMIGYKNSAYHEFGKAAAKIDDIANYIPARLSVPVIALAALILNGRAKAAFKTAFNEGAFHSSPNAGYPEASFAGALCITLGGPNYYNGKIVDKPFIGKRFSPVNYNDIKKSCDLMLLSALFWVIGISAIAALF